MCLDQQQPTAQTPPFLPGPSAATDPNAPQAQPGQAPAPAPTVVHSKFGNLLRFIANPLQDAMVGAASVGPTNAAGGGSFGTSFAKGFGGATEFEQQKKAAQVEQQYRAAEEQRLEQQANEQQALAKKYEEQANAPQPPKVYQFGNDSYLWDQKSGQFVPAIDSQGNPLGGAKQTKKPAPKIIQTGPLAGYDEEGNPATTQMPLPSSVNVQGVNLPIDQSQQPGLSLPSVAQAAEAQKAQQTQQKDTKGNWQSEWTRPSESSPEQLVLVDKNPDSPTFGQQKAIKGVTKFDAPNKIADRITKAQNQQAQVEGLADAAVSQFGENYDQALTAVRTSKVIPDELKALVRNRIREIAKPGKSGPRPNPLNDLIEQATQGVPVPAQ